jgi:AhpD family alkylhydroperoxidase
VTPRLEVPAGPGGPPVQVWNLRPELLPTVSAMIDGPYRRSQLPAREREAARMRIAQLNDCVLCRDFRAGSARAAGATEDLYAHVDQPDPDRYTPRERLAIEFAERFTLEHQAMDDAFFERLRGEFSDAEIVDLSVCCAAFLGLGRVLAVLGIDGPAAPDDGAAPAATADPPG